MTEASLRKLFPMASKSFIQENLSAVSTQLIAKKPVAGNSVRKRVLSEKPYVALIGKDASDVSFTIPVAPMGAPRMTQRDRWAKRPCVVRYHEWRDAVRPHVPVDLPKNPSGVSWTAYFPFPKSYSEKKRKELAGKDHREKPDRDNVDKALLDFLFEQDKGIAHGTIRKLWDDGKGPRIEVLVHQ